MKLIIFFIFLFPVIAFCQSSIGVNIGYQNSLYFNTYSKVLDIPSCCKEYIKPISNSISFGLFHTAILNQNLSLISTFQYSSITPTSIVNISYPVLINNKLQTVDFEYTSNFSFSQIALSSGIEYIISNAFSIGSRVGLVSEFDTKYSQNENILTEGVQYKNPDFESVSNRTISSFVVKPTLVAFVHYKYPMNRNYSIVSRLDVATVLGNNSIPINRSNLQTRLLLGIEYYFINTSKDNPLNPNNEKE